MEIADATADFRKSMVATRYGGHELRPQKFMMLLFGTKLFETSKTLVLGT